MVRGLSLGSVAGGDESPAYVDDLLSQGTKVLQDAGATRIVADTDKGNVPMARAFERAGYHRFLTRAACAIELAAHRRTPAQSSID